MAGLTHDTCNQIEACLAAFAVDERRSVSFSLLDGSFSQSIRGAYPRIAASLSKVPIVAAFLVKNPDLHELVDCRMLAESFLPSLSNCFRDGGKLTIAQLIILAIAASDNSSADHIARLVGYDAVNAFCASLGCSKETRVSVGYTDKDVVNQFSENTVTGDDFNIILRSVTLDDRLSIIENAMANNIMKTRMPALLKSKFKISHKTGTFIIPGVCNDGGVIWHPYCPFVLTFLSEKQDNISKTSEDIASCTASIVDIFNEICGDNLLSP